MKKKVTKRNNSELDKFDRKQKRHAAPMQKDTKNKYSIYEDFDDDDLDNMYNLDEDEEE